MAPNIPEVQYEACWIEDDGLYSCGCGHASIAGAMGCLTRDGRSFIRAVQNDTTRSLDEDELHEFIALLCGRFSSSQK